VCVDIYKKLANTEVTQEDQIIFDTKHIFRENYMGFFGTTYNFIYPNTHTNRQARRSI
jgi:hypothetical protein